MTQSKLKIRAATSADIPDLKEVKADLTEKQIKARFKRQKENKAVWLVAEIEEKVCGFILLKWLGKPTAPDYPDLEDLFVQPEYRGQGIAPQLVEYAEKLARDAGYPKIGLAVNPDPRCAAHKLYAKLGYVVVKDKPYVDGVYNGVKDWVVDMAKNL
jgi:GNAT superfamily N-acetyltransferase